MYLTPDDVSYLMLMAGWFISLALCLILICFRRFRSRENPFAWIVWANLFAGVLYLAQFPSSNAQNGLFARADPDYTVAPSVADIDSLYIPDLPHLERAAYVCVHSYSSSTCDFPIGRKIAAGRFSFIEVGRDPILRYEIHYGEAACLDYTDIQSFRSPMRNPHGIVPALGICVMWQEVETANATHEFRTEDREQSFPSQRHYIHAELVERDTDTVIAQFDGWDGASPYFLDYPIEEPRRPDGALGEILRIPPYPNGGYDRAGVDRMLEEYGFDEDILMAAAMSPLQSYQASAIWLACRDRLANSISPENKARLREVSETLFSDAPDWRYPESCPAWAR